MLRTLLQAKLHRGRVTRSDLNYEGSCGISEALLERSGIDEFQYIEIDNVTNGERFNAYTTRAPRDSGEISLNGATARGARIGDLLIVAAYSTYTDTDVENH
jgi:aspartate 1-decarboxylase